MIVSPSFATADLPSSPADPRERDRFVLGHAGLCRRAAQRFVRPGLERSDLEQVAAIGLLKAVDRYEAERGTPFEAFAWLSILGELRHHVRDAEHLVRLPRGISEALPAYRRVADSLMQRLEREATEGELAEHLGLSGAEVRSVRQASLAVGRRDDASAWRSADRAAPANVMDWSDRVDLDAALATLAPRERLVVVGSFLLGLSNAELGDALAVSTRHVTRLRRRALAALHETRELALSA